MFREAFEKLKASGMNGNDIFEQFRAVDGCIWEEMRDWYYVNELKPFVGKLSERLGFGTYERLPQSTISYSDFDLAVTQMRAEATGEPRYFRRVELFKLGSLMAQEVDKCLASGAKEAESVLPVVAKMKLGELPAKEWEAIIISLRENWTNYNIFDRQFLKGTDEGWLIGHEIWGRDYGH